MKKLFIFAVAALAMIGCTKKDNLSLQNVVDTNGVIAFGSLHEKMTKGTAADAGKLGNDFVVYGFKTNGETVAADPVVFDLYHVGYTAGTANTTESNTANWEYVGYNSEKGKTQSIKYWDYSTSNYVFSAVAGPVLNISKIESVTAPATIYDKGWNVELASSGELSDLYASMRTPVAKSNYSQTVTLTFYNLASKIRFAMYETVPGYSVKIDKVYYNDGTWKTFNDKFAINGTFKTANADVNTPLTITYYDDAVASVENRPKVTFSDAAVTVTGYGAFGTNLLSATALGTTSTTATYDKSDKSYTSILPYLNDGGMQLYVDYTLTSTDGSNETIEVKHASANVPANFTQWKENFAYTYIFKISDKTNGTTGTPGDPTDPTIDPTDPEGLFPITFDACVVDAEDGIQETITTVAEPSITTYAMGKIVTANDEYTAGDIYYTVMNAGNLVNIAGTTTRVYEVHNYTYNSFEVDVTEAMMANYLNNFCVLTSLNTIDFADNVPLSDGTNLTFDHGKCLKFPAESGKVYAIAYDYNPGSGWTTAYKVVKVAGSPATTTTTTMFTDALAGSATSATISAVGGTADLFVAQNGIGAIGVAPCFEITNTGGNDALQIVPATPAVDGKYTISVDAEAIKAGKANDTYTVTFDGATVTITVNIAYALTSSPIAVTAGESNTFTLTAAGSALSGAVIVNSNDGITIEETVTPGTYQVTVASDVAYLAAGYDATIAGVALKINVDSYAFSDATLTIDRKLSGSNTGTITINKNGSAQTGLSLTTSPALASGTSVSESAGVYTYTVTEASAGGTYDISYKNATAKVIVNAYTMNDVTIAKTSGVEGTKYLTVSVTGGLYNALVAGLKIYDGGANDVTASFAVGTNGRDIRLSHVTAAAGTYTAKYSVGGVEVAQSTITVTD